MYKNIKTAWVLAFVMLFGACEVDQEYGLDRTIFTDPVVESILGALEVVAGTTQSYTVEAFRQESTYTWTVSGATADATDGTTINVTFQNAGVTSVTISVTENGGSPESITVDVVVEAPVGTFSNADAIPVRNGSTVELLLEFDIPIGTAPSVALGAGSGTLSTVIAVEGSSSSFTVDYTHAGGGNGSVVVDVSGAVAAGTHGAGTMDASSFTVDVDNDGPGEGLAYSDGDGISVQPGTALIISVEFDEEIVATDEDGLIEFTATGGGLMAIEGLLEDQGDNIWSATVTADAVAAGDINSTYTFTFDGFTDLAGNGGFISNRSNLNVDNIIATLDPADAAVLDLGGSRLEVEADYSEEGEVFYVVVESGAVAPTSIDDFTGVLSGSFDNNYDFENPDFVAPDDYDVYYIHVDGAGIESVVSGAYAVTIAG